MTTPALYQNETTTSTRERAVTYVCARCSREKKDTAVVQLVYAVETTRTRTWGITGTRYQVSERWTLDGVTLPHHRALECKCGRGFMDPRVVRGRFSAEHKCNARCTHAKGGDCECECGGRNHGKGFRA